MKAKEKLRYGPKHWDVALPGIHPHRGSASRVDVAAGSSGPDPPLRVVPLRVLPIRYPYRYPWSRSVAERQQHHTLGVVVHLTINQFHTAMRPQLGLCALDRRGPPSKREKWLWETSTHEICADLSLVPK